MASILDATVDALTSDPEASMAEIARRAGVVRATVYVHFPTRESLIDAVTHRAITEVAAVIAGAEPARGEPVDALRRVVTSAWRTLGRYHPLVAVNAQLSHSELHARHHSVHEVLGPLIKRGQREGAFRVDAPAEWHVAMMLSIIHTASAEVAAGRATEARAESEVLETVLGALGARADQAQSPARIG